MSQSTLAVTWLDNRPTTSDTLRVRTSANGTMWNAERLLAPKFDEGLLKRGSTTDKVLSVAYAAVLPLGSQMGSVAQVRSNKISKAFTVLSDCFGVPSRFNYFGSSQRESFLPGTGPCANFVGVYQSMQLNATDPLTPFRYTAWQLGPDGHPFGPVFLSSKDLHGQDGVPDSKSAPLNRIGEYTASDCGDRWGWIVWTDLRNGKAEIWGAQVSLAK